LFCGEGREERGRGGEGREGKGREGEEGKGDINTSIPGMPEEPKLARGQRALILVLMSLSIGLQALAANDMYYKVRVRREGAPAADSVDGFVRACALESSSFSDTLVIALDAKGIVML